MTKIDTMPEGQIEALAKVLGECGSGTDITRILQNQGLIDSSGESTKWRRLYWMFLDLQRRDRCANRVLSFIESFLTRPVLWGVKLYLSSIAANSTPFWHFRDWNSVRTATLDDGRQRGPSARRSVVKRRFAQNFRADFCIRKC